MKKKTLFTRKSIKMWKRLHPDIGAGKRYSLIQKDLVLLAIEALFLTAQYRNCTFFLFAAVMISMRYKKKKKKKNRHRRVFCTGVEVEKNKMWKKNKMGLSCREGE